MKKCGKFCVCILLLLNACVKSTFYTKPEDYYIFEKTLNFEISIGYDNSLHDYNETLLLVHTALEHIEKTLNVKFHIIMEKIVELDPNLGIDQAPVCATQLNPTKREKDRHLNLCVVPFPLSENDDNDSLILGVYVPRLGINLISKTEDKMLFLNIIVHEIGHFLGARHTNNGIMKESLTKQQTKNGILKFSKTSIEQIREKQKVLGDTNEMCWQSINF